MRVAPGLAALGSALLLAPGCARVGPPPPPAPTPQETPELVIEVALPEDDGWTVPAPPEEDLSDPLLHSPVTRDPGFAAQVERWERFWSGQEREWFPTYLERMAAWGPLVDRELADAGLPASLRYLPIIESGYSPRAVSRASAVGLWQFMAPTARGYGMEVGPLVDERRDPVKATAGATRYLARLRERYGSWYLALAAYNGGPARVDRLLAVHAPESTRSDSLFLVLAPHLPRETRDFLPRLVAAARVAGAPESYGLRSPAPTPAMTWDEVTVPDATTLDVVAAAAGVDEDEVVRLNPQLVRRVTPRGEATTIRVPAGRGRRFTAAYALIPPGERVTSTEHVVAAGETLWGISRRYGVRVDDLTAANPRVDPRRMRPGLRLLVPLTPGARRRSVQVAAASPADTHVVRRGDTLWDVARRYGVALEDLKRWNGLADADVLRPGQTLRLGG